MLKYWQRSSVVVMDYEKIGEYIQIKRKAINMTQAELGEKLGVTSKAVSKWECGVALPDVSLFTDLCKILNIEITELLEGKDKNDENLIISKRKNIIIAILSIVLIPLLLISIALGLYYEQNHDNVHVYDIVSDNNDFKITGTLISINDDNYINISDIRYVPQHETKILYGTKIECELYYQDDLLVKKNNLIETLNSFNNHLSSVSLYHKFNISKDADWADYLILRINFTDNNEIMRQFTTGLLLK